MSTNQDIGGEGESTIGGTVVVRALPTVKKAQDSTPAHFHALDGLRGIGVLAVLGYHFGASFLTGGYLGVDVFFVISGFVVTRNLVRIQQDGRWARGFYLRRASRLYPTLLVMLAALSITWLVGGTIGQDKLIALVGGALMSYNLALLYFGAEAEGPLHLWSLGVEWHFYLLAPLLLAIGRTSIKPARRALLLAATAGFVALVRLVLLGTNAVDSFTLYLNTLTRLDGLLLGAALAVTPATMLLAIPTRRLMGPLVAGIVAAMLIGPAWGERAPVTLGLVVPLVGLLAAGIVVAEINAKQTDEGRSWGRTILESPALIWAGQRSYSMYLVHYFIGVTLLAGGEELWQGWPRFSLQLIASLIGAELLYRLVEQPARRAINRRI